MAYGIDNSCMSAGDFPLNKGRAGVSWPLLLVLLILALLILHRSYYLRHFGFIYTDGDQTAFWYQADDIAHGFFREPCLYGQSYNIPIEAWLGAPLLLLHVPAYVALPLVATVLGILPFLAFASLAYRRGQRWAASIILLIPLALPMEYTVVSSLPRGFVNGLAVSIPTLVCWLFFRSRIACFFAAFFSVLALATNPNCSIVLLAAGVFALLTQYRSIDFYLFTLIGGIAALPAPWLIQRFYRLHPQCDAYHPKVTSHFSWELLKDSLFAYGSPSLSLNHEDMNLFFGHFVPVLERGWVILCILPALVILLLLVRRMRAATAILASFGFIIFSLGIERIHSASDNVFYSGSRMFLAIPILIAMGLLWFDAGLECCKRMRVLVSMIRGVLIVGMLTLGCVDFFYGAKLLGSQSPLVVERTLPPVESVEHLLADTRAVSNACQQYHADLVLIGQSFFTCFDDAGPILSHHEVKTLSPFFERRTYLIEEERARRHVRVLVYLPTEWQTFLARQPLFHMTVISSSPSILLLEMAQPGMSGMDIAARIGIPYRAQL